MLCFALQSPHRFDSHPSWPDTFVFQLEPLSDGCVNGNRWQGASPAINPLPNSPLVTLVGFGPLLALVVSVTKHERGYSVTELMLVVGIMGVVGAMAVMQIGSSAPAAKGDGGMRVVLAQLTSARELSVSQRRQMQVSFINGNQVQITRLEVPAGTTTLSTVSLEGGVTFNLISGVGDTPDAFGINSAIAFGTATKIIFNSDGTMIDQNGNPLNGTVYTSIPSVVQSFRAVTVLGGTGRIRGYKWNGSKWVLA
jgi:Tfp pilus assembly protein FimT